MTIYQLNPAVSRKQMERFERNKFLLSENGSLNTKKRGIIHKKSLKIVLPVEQRYCDTS